MLDSPHEFAHTGETMKVPHAGNGPLFGVGENRSMRIMKCGKSPRRKLSWLVILVCAVGLLIVIDWRPKDRTNTQVIGVFKRYFLQEVPKSVTNIRIDQPGKFQGRTYAMHFSINRDDFTKLMKSRSFVKVYKLKYEDGQLSWFWKSGEDNVLGMPTHGFGLPLYSQGRNPGWFRLDKLDSYESYAFHQQGDLVNPQLSGGSNLIKGHTTILTLIYSEKEGEAYFVANDYSH